MAKSSAYRTESWEIYKVERIRSDLYQTQAVLLRGEQILRNNIVDLVLEEKWPPKDLKGDHQHQKQIEQSRVASVSSEGQRLGILRAILALEVLLNMNYPDPDVRDL